MGRKDRLKSNNKQQILGAELAMYEVGIPPHHNPEIPTALLVSIDNKVSEIL